MAQVSKIIAQVPIKEEAKVVWEGIHSHIEHRTIYKALQISIDDIADAEVPQWVALLACCAGSSALNIWLVSAAFGPVGWATIAAAIVIDCLVCFAAISPDKLKQAHGTANVVQVNGDWHRV